MRDYCPHSYTAIGLLNAVLEPLKYWKVSSQLQMSHVSVFSLYSIVISVPGPLCITKSYKVREERISRRSRTLS